LVQPGGEIQAFGRKANELFRATTHPGAVDLPIEGVFPSLDGATGWLNAEPLRAVGLRGNIVLISFWTYTCINWLRSLPYVWAKGLRRRSREQISAWVTCQGIAFHPHVHPIG